ncbi:MAG: hypothetical protein ACE5K0_10560 [Candidatus Methanofastidiosia archaeon]
MYLDKILGTSTKINIINLLVNNEDISYVEKEVAQKTHCSVSEINRQIKDLVASGLVNMERVGRSKIYTINKKHFLFLPLKKLFIQLSETYREIVNIIVEHIVRNHKIMCVILMGSLFEGRIREDIVKEPSDIDLMFVVEENVDLIRKELINFVNNDINLKYGIVIYPIVISRKEYEKGLKENVPLIIEAHSRGEILYGRRPRRFG